MNTRHLGALIMLLVGCTAEHHPRMASLPLAKQAVSVTPARELTQAVGDEVIGTVRARNVAAISSSVMGNVRTLKVTVGSRVRAGDVLVQLSAGEIDAKANQAGAMFKQAELDLQRAEQLKASNAIPTARYEATNAQYRVAEATLAEANVMRGYTTLRAPFSGVITEKRCEVGDLAVPGTPLLVLESPGALRLEAAVPEMIAQELHRGDVLTVRIDSVATPLSATLSELSPSADPTSRTVLVKLDLPNAPGLRPGLFGRLSVQTGEARAIVVPAPAVVRRGQLELVFVVKDQKAQLRIVRTGRSRDGQTEVLAGLDDGEAVVVEGAQQVVDGQPVEISP